MATVIKKISELEQLTDLSSSANVIIEENGKAKRFSAQNIGKVKTVNGIEPDESGNIVITGVTGGTGSTFVQADWNQNDETAADYVKNRTHYSNGFVEKTYLPETTTVTCCYANLLAADIIPDNTYIVTWDGVDYECVAYADENGDVIGNQLLAGVSSVDSGEPFFIGEWEDFAEDDSIVYMWAVGFIENKVHTIKVSEKIVDGDNVVIEEIFPETELIDYDSSLSDYRGYSINTDIGATYTVVWDGNEYECIAKGDEDMDIRYLGNCSLFPYWDEDQSVEDTGEPFLVLGNFNEEYNDWTEIFHKIAGAHTIEIKGLVENIQTIDPKFLPKDGFGYESIETATIIDTDVDIGEELFAQISKNAVFIEGETYQVTFNDESYSCVAWVTEQGGFAIGNGNIYGGENRGDDVPFSCDSYIGEGFYLNVEAEGTYYIKIVGTTNKTHVIDHKYLGIRPLEIRCREWEVDGSSYTKTCTYDGSQNNDRYIYIDPLPPASSSSNGMLLGVVNGGWGVVKESVTSVNGMTGDVVISGGGVTSWNDLTDKPFYEESFSIDIEWDGVIGDRPCVAAGSDPDGNTLYLVHVSDEVISPEALNEMTMGVSENGENSQILLAGMAMEMGGLVLVGDGNIAVAPYDNFNYMDSILFPKAGIYFAKIGESLYASSLKGEATVVNKLDKKYIDHPITLTVSYTYNNAESGEYTDVSTDLGYAEVAEAYKAGCPIFVAEKITDGSEEVVRCPATVVGDNYVEMLDTYMMFNLVYTRLSDNQMVAIEISHPLRGGQTEMYNIPSSALPTPGYDGQILGVVDGEWSSMDAPSGLPEVNAGNNGNVLTVVGGEWSAGNINALPAVTAESEGAFLRIVDGVPTWVVLEVAEAGAY